MARPTRIDIKDGWYHVTARGIEKRYIYRNDRDRMHFLRIVEKAVERFDLVLHGYVLMDNHYHLIVQTPEANLSLAMQWLNVSYSVWFNRKHDRVGPLFQGRFKSIPVENSGWAFELSLYVHLNPAMRRSLGTDKQSKVAEMRGYKIPDKEIIKARLTTIRSYRWSSYNAYAGYQHRPSWLTTSVLLSRASDQLAFASREYRKHIHARITGGWPDQLQEGLSQKIAIGTVRFSNQVRALAKPAREETGKRSYRARATPKQTIAVIENIRGLAYEEFMHIKGDWGKPLLLWSMRNFCGMTLRQIGDAIGGVDYAAVQIMISRFEKRALSEKILAKRMRQARKELLYVET